jgi:hypothetical protein
VHVELLVLRDACGLERGQGRRELGGVARDDGDVRTARGEQERQGQAEP